MPIPVPAGQGSDEMPIVTHDEVRARIDQLRLSYHGYKRQLERLDLAPERRARLETDINLLEEEISTLEKIAQLGRIEPDRAKIEALVRERLHEVRAALAADPALYGLSAEQRDYTSGEVSALLWVLREDRLSMSMQQFAHSRRQPEHTERTLASALIQRLRNPADRDAQASAAYELGKLHVVEAIPYLAAALEAPAPVAEMALNALASFTEQELLDAGLPAEVRSRIVRSAGRGGVQGRG
jgi:predicted HTH domain antitoxin